MQDISRLRAIVRRRTRKLKAKPTESTIGADIRFLLSVLKWATTVSEGEVALLDVNPVAAYKPPKSPAPKRPLATRERFLRVTVTREAPAGGMF